MQSMKQQLLDFVTPFSFGSERTLTHYDRNMLDELVRALVQQAPELDLTESFSLLEGTWTCVYTNSRYVLGLNKMPFVNLSGVYQKVYIEHDNAGHYFNIGELSHSSSVRLACGEYAYIHASPTEPGRIDVQYRYFYFAMRLLSTYEGHENLASGLEVNRLRRSFRLPFNKSGWQTVVYLDNDMRIVYGNEGGVFILTKQLEDH